MQTVTRLLGEINRGNAAAENELFALVYDDLHELARRHLANFRDGSLEATGLVHEICQRLLGGQGISAGDRQHFYRIVSRAMRHLLIDRGRARRAQKRDGRLKRQELVEFTADQETFRFDVLDLNEALVELERQHPDTARLVQLRFFGGCTFEEAAEALDSTVARVRARWEFARAWLHERLSRGPNTGKN